METTETLTVLAPQSNPHSYAAICIPAEQPLTAAQRMPLTHEEKRMLADNELQIEQGLNSYYEIGRALRVIQLGKLYREKYPTFDQYCRERWGFSRHRGYQLIQSSEAAQTLVENFQQTLPENDYQSRLLLKLPDANARVRAMKRAKELAGDKKLTGAHIKQAIKEAQEPAEPDIIDVEIVSQPEQSTEPVPVAADRIPKPEQAVKPTNLIVATSLFEQDNETNEQAIERLFTGLREFAASKKWEAGFTNIVDELEGRVGRLLRDQRQLAA